MLLRVLPLLIALALSLAPKSQAAVFIASPPASSPLAATPENACTAFLEDGSEARIGLLCHNDPVNHTDPTGLAIDTIADIGFIGYDIYKLATEGGGQGGENWKALGLDGAAAAIPFATGAGVAFRGVKAAERAAEAGRASKYEDSTKAGSRLINRETNVTRSQFEKNLAEGGWQKSVSKDGKVANYEKDGAKYSVRSDAKSTSGPTADYYKPGHDKPDIKIRLKKDE